MSIADKKHEEILAYAESIKEAYPEIKPEEMEKALEIEYIGGKDAFSFATTGVIRLPYQGFVSLVTVVYDSIHKIFETNPKEKLELKRLIIKQVLDSIFPHVISQ